MNDDFDSEIEDRNISRKDQLSYKNTIQYLATQFLIHRDSLDIHKYVGSLLSSIYFNIEGLPLRDKIESYKKELNVEREKKIEEYYSGERYDVYRTPKKAKFKMKLHVWYYQSLGSFIIDLLAQHDALIKSKKGVETGLERGDIYTS